MNVSSPAKRTPLSRVMTAVIAGVGFLIPAISLWFLFVQPLYSTKPIHKAAQEGNLAEIQRLVEQGTPVDMKGPHWDTPLTIALANGHAEVAKYLVSKGANIRHKLLPAIATKDMALVKMLLSRGAKAEPEDLAAAVSRQLISGTNTEFADCLLQSGAAIDARHRWSRDGGIERHDGYTALHIAADLRDLQLVEFLVKRGANVNSRNKWRDTPLSVSESSYKVFPNGAGGPGIHYYYEVPPSPAIAAFLRSQGGH